jgi:hypothetical protein
VASDGGGATRLHSLRGRASLGKPDPTRSPPPSFLPSPVELALLRFAVATIVATIAIAIAIVASLSRNVHMPPRAVPASIATARPSLQECLREHAVPGIWIDIRISRWLGPQRCSVHRLRHGKRECALRGSITLVDAEIRFRQWPFGSPEVRRLLTSVASVTGVQQLISDRRFDRQRRSEERVVLV